MSLMKKSLFVVALMVFAFGLSGAAKAGSFGTPDPTLGSTVLGWFDLSIGGMDDVLPVVVNASNVNYPAGVGKGVHIIVWNVRSQHVWDRNEPFTPWHVRGFSVRDIILSMPPAQRNQVIVTLDDGAQRFRGYFTMTTVFEFPGTLLPGLDPEYPFTYENHLGGWMYLTNLLEGQADGLPLTSVEASTLYAAYSQAVGDETVFMMSFMADFWNREFWGTYLLPYLNDQAPNPRALTESGVLYSRLYNCNVLDFYFRDDDGLDQDFLSDTPYRDSQVFERFDAAAGINSQLVTRGLVIRSDDAWLEFPERASTPYNTGGMLLIGRFFKDFAATIANEFANKLVIWTDRNGGAATRQTQAVIWDENEVAISLPIFFPNELTVLRIDELVGTIPGGVIVFDTRQIQHSNGYNPVLGFHLQWSWGYTGPFGPFVCPSNLLGGFLVDLTHSSMLQLLGWTTTEALATADLTWGAAFPMLRDYKVGSPVETFAVGFNDRAYPIVPTEVEE